MPATRVGTRASALARWQTDEIVRQWRAIDPTLEVEIVDLTTAGDDHADAPLERMEGTGFFTSTLERALLANAIDVAVHSMKDLPVASTSGLTVIAVPARGPVEDVLCARDGAALDALPPGARVGTSSPRRVAQLRALRSDLEYVAQRGNVPTRLERVARGDLDAVVLARAGVARLGLEGRVTEVFTFERVLTAPAQGAIAVQTRANDQPRNAALARLEHAPTRAAVDTERAVLHALRGGCSVPVGAHAIANGGSITVDAGVFDLSGRRALRARREGDVPERVGIEAARALLAQGASEILEALDREPRVAGERPR
jgi:hydroxymethylbilane synthase